MARIATVAQIHAYAATVRKQFHGQGYSITPNSYGIRTECTYCHESATLNPEAWMRGHRDECNAHRAPRPDFVEETHNADGTRNRILYYGIK